MEGLPTGTLLSSGLVTIYKYLERKGRVYNNIIALVCGIEIFLIFSIETCFYKLSKVRKFCCQYKELISLG